MSTPSAHSASASHDHSAGHDAHAGFPWKYIFVAIALWCGTIVTFLVAQGVHTSWTLPIALVIATTKGSLVAMFFMHLYGDRGLPKLVLLTAVVLFILMITLIVADLHFRFGLVAPYGAEVPVPPRVLEWKL